MHWLMRSVYLHCINGVGINILHSPFSRVLGIGLGGEVVQHHGDAASRGGGGGGGRRKSVKHLFEGGVVFLPIHLRLVGGDVASWNVELDRAAIPHGELDGGEEAGLGEFDAFAAEFEIERLGGGGGSGGGGGGFGC